MGDKTTTTKDIISKLQNSLVDLESKNPKTVEEAAYGVSATLIAWENEIGTLDERFLEIEHLALDLEIPKELVENYEAKLKELIDRIKSLHEQ